MANFFAELNADSDSLAPAEGPNEEEEEFALFKSSFNFYFNLTKYQLQGFTNKTPEIRIPLY